MLVNSLQYVFLDKTGYSYLDQLEKNAIAFGDNESENGKGFFSQENRLQQLVFLLYKDILNKGYENDGKVLFEENILSAMNDFCNKPTGCFIWFKFNDFEIKYNVQFKKLDSIHNKDFFNKVYLVKADDFGDLI